MVQVIYKIPLRCSALLNVQNDDKDCFPWPILAHFHPIADSKNGYSTKVSTFRQCFDEVNFQGFDFSNGFRCIVVHNFAKLNKKSKKNFN